MMSLLLISTPIAATAADNSRKVPADAHQNDWSNGWSCNRGIRKVKDVCVAVPISANDYLRADGDNFACERGCLKSDGAGVAINVPEYGFLNGSGDGWQCEPGYQVSADACVAAFVPANAYLNSAGDGWRGAGHTWTDRRCTRGCHPASAA